MIKSKSYHSFFFFYININIFSFVIRYSSIKYTAIQTVFVYIIIITIVGHVVQNDAPRRDGPIIFLFKTYSCWHILFLHSLKIRFLIHRIYHCKSNNTFNFSLYGTVNTIVVLLSNLGVMFKWLNCIQFVIESLEQLSKTTSTMCRKTVYHFWNLSFKLTFHISTLPYTLWLTCMILGGFLNHLGDDNQLKIGLSCRRSLRCQRWNNLYKCRVGNYHNIKYSRWVDKFKYNMKSKLI